MLKNGSVVAQNPPPPRAGKVRLCTDDWPERDRLALFREQHGRNRVAVEPLPGAPFRIDIELRWLPGLGLFSASRSALRSEKPKDLFSDGNDQIFINLEGEALAQQFGREVVLQPGDAIAFSGCDPGSLTKGGKLASLIFPRRAFDLLLRNPADCFARPIRKTTPALQLLTGYLDILRRESLATPELQQLTVAHLYDLMALVMGATRDAAELAKGRGMPAAHLHVIKKDILAALEDDLSLDRIAARRRLSPRYVRMLFEAEGTTFTEFVRDQRLTRAHRMLTSSRFDRQRIADIAYDVGFNDLSYFNRMFRRRFGLAPGEVRARAIAEA